MNLLRDFNEATSFDYLRDYGLAVRARIDTTRDFVEDEAAFARLAAERGAEEGNAFKYFVKGSRLTKYVFRGQIVLVCSLRCVRFMLGLCLAARYLALLHFSILYNIRGCLVVLLRF